MDTPTQNHNLKEAIAAFQNLKPDEIDVLAGNGATNYTGLPDDVDYDIPRIIATYWRPALPAAAAKLLDYIIYKTWGFHKEQDEISYDQFVNGTATKDETGKEIIRHDYGAGVAKGALTPNLMLLEILGLIEVGRRQNPFTKEKMTSSYRARTINDYGKLSEKEREAFLFTDPFRKVKAAQAILKKYMNMESKGG